MKDVAQAAGVSVPTVSRFLNGSLRLPEPTARRIEAAIGALNYRPNPHARRLSLGRSDTIGLVVPDIANPFFASSSRRWRPRPTAAASASRSSLH